MGISFKSLPHYPDFRDGHQFFTDLQIWALNYEKRVMLPNEWNHKLANETTAILLYNLPESMKPFGKHVVSSLMDDRLRKAMMSVCSSPSFLFFLPLLTPRMLM